MPQLPVHRASIIIPDLEGMNFRIIDQQINEIITDPVALPKDISPETLILKMLIMSLIHSIIRTTGILKQISQ